MKRIRLIVAYDGTTYHGFQFQPGLLTIEGVLNEALSFLTGEQVQVLGASRTDAGVHARGNVAVFDTKASIPPDRFFMALNTKLPGDIRIVRSDEVAADWNPHEQEAVKTYSYRIMNSRVYDPLKIRYAFHFVRKLNLAAMQEAAGFLVGEHDFTSFANPSSQVLQNGGSAIRRIDSINISCCEPSDRMRSGACDSCGGESKEVCGRNTGTGAEEKAYLGDITITVRGNGFLYNMVRIIAGTLLEVGTGRFQPEDMKQILEAKDRREAGLTAPPQGLCLEEIRYL